MPIFLHLSHLVSLAQYQYFVTTVIVPCTHLFNHSLVFLTHSFAAISAFSKILRRNQTKLCDRSVSEASC